LATPQLIIAIAFVGVAFLVIYLWDKWTTRRLVTDVLTKIASADGGQKLRPKSDFIVDVSETGATCVRADGRTESVKWDDLQRVEILTTDDGPFAPDIFWVLHGSSNGCVIPWGATGEQTLLERLQALPNFRNEVIVNATSLTNCNQLLCWERSPNNA
jgi:hypothetical protein